ncbi:MAG: hypothetical protein U9M89_00725 [Patescibacteria group bacterium]|nr:hypothetical protein [Patescibacteria group bacterium]
MEGNLNPKPASKRDLPKDMWGEDDSPVSETPKPAPPPPPPKPIQKPPESPSTPTPPKQKAEPLGIGVEVPDHHIGKKPKKGSWVPGFLLWIAFLGIIGYSGWYFWPNILGWVDGLFTQVLEIDDPENQEITTTIDNQVAWQTREQIEGLGLMIVGSETTVPGAMPVGGLSPRAEYFKVGKFRDGSFQNSDIVIAYVHSQTDLGLSRNKFYRFAVKGANVVLLANHSPRLFDGDPLDNEKFIVDNEYVIESLMYPDELTDSQFEDQYLRNIGSMPSVPVRLTDKWFDKERITKNWDPVYSHPKLGAAYTDPLPQTIASLGSGGGPENGFYFKAPDGSIKTYVIAVESVLGSDYTSRLKGAPKIDWRIGGTNRDEYRMDDVGSCSSLNFTSVMPSSLMDDLIPATKDGSGPVVYELRNDDHQMLQELHGYAISYEENKDLSFNKFVDSHPLFFWEDVFGRLIRFQGTQYSYQLDC